MRPGEFKILAALVEIPKGLTFTELKEVTALSNPVLSEYLRVLLEQGIILKTAIGDDDKRRTRYRYVLAEAYQSVEKFEGIERSFLRMMRSIPFEGSRIAMVKDPELRKNIYSDFLRFHVGNIDILIMVAIREAVIQTLEKNRKGEYEFSKNLTKITKKKAKRFAKQAVRLWETEMMEYNRNIQDAMLNWVIPYVQMLALAYMANAIFMPAALKTAAQRFSKENIMSMYWFKELEAIDDELAKRDPEFAKLLKEQRELERKIENEH